MNQGANMQVAKQTPSGIWKPYTYKFFFCCSCAEAAAPPVAIRKFFYSQNVIDLIFNSGCIGFLLRPPKPEGGAIGWVVFLLLLTMVISTIVGFVMSCLARSELSALMKGGKGSSPVKKTKLALLLMTIALGITVFFFVFFICFCLYFALIASKDDNDLAKALGALLLIFALLMLPFALMWGSQLCQALKMKNAVRDCGSENAF